MAASTHQASGSEDISECPVCQDDYKDPKILVCNHHFCRGCLEGIAGRKDSFECPTCCQETLLGKNQQVADLPHPVLVHELHRKISGLLGGAATATVRRCDPCGSDKVMAGSHCFQCKQNFCDDCRAKHKKVRKFESHRAEPIYNCVFCEAHPDDVITDYCKTCKKGICLKCIMGDHSDHKMEDIYVLAEVGSQNLEEYVRQGGMFLDHAEFREVFKQISEAEKLRNHFRDSVSDLRGLLKVFEKKMETLERSTEEKLSTELQNMKSYASDLHDFVSSEDKLLDFAKHILERSHEPEEDEVFTPPADGADTVSSYTAHLPHFEDTFNFLCRGLKELIDHCDIHYHSRVLGKRSAGPTVNTSPLDGLSESLSFSVGCKIHGLVADAKRQCLVVCTDDKASPIQVYNQHGKLVKRLGGEVKALVNNDIRGISVDTKRSLYLCLVEGALVMVDAAGKAKAAVKIERSMSTGVSYSEEEDVYVVSDWSEHKVYVIDATSRVIVKEIGDPGPEDKHFDGPYNVHVGYMSGIDQQCIIVSDWFDKSVKVHGMMGRHIKTFGTLGETDGRLCHPWGVTTDPSGRVLVCDRGNRRILAFWTENNQDHWRCLVESSQLREDLPHYVSCDHQTRVLAVGFETGLVQVFR